MVTDGDIAGYFYFPSAISDSGKVEYRSENVSNIKNLEEQLYHLIEDVIVESKSLSRD